MIFVGFVVLYVIFLGDDIFVYELVSIFSIWIYQKIILVQMGYEMFCSLELCYCCFKE